MSNEVLFEIKGSVAIITLNRPNRKNAINQALLSGLYKSIEKMASFILPPKCFTVFIVRILIAVILSRQSPVFSIAKLKF